MPWTQRILVAAILLRVCDVLVRLVVVILAADWSRVNTWNCVLPLRVRALTYFVPFFRNYLQRILWQLKHRRFRRDPYTYSLWPLVFCVVLSRRRSASSG